MCVWVISTHRFLMAVPTGDVRPRPHGHTTRQSSVPSRSLANYRQSGALLDYWVPEQRGVPVLGALLWNDRSGIPGKTAEVSGWNPEWESSSGRQPAHHVPARASQSVIRTLMILWRARVPASSMGLGKCNIWDRGPNTFLFSRNSPVDFYASTVYVPQLSSPSTYCSAKMNPVFVQSTWAINL